MKKIWSSLHGQPYQPVSYRPAQLTEQAALRPLGTDEHEPHLTDAIPVGYPADDAMVTDLVRKSLEQVLVRV